MLVVERVNPPYRGGRKERIPMATEDEVRQASEQFYEALNRTLNGDPGPMVEVWSHGSDVATMHPLGGRDFGWDAVRAGWEQVAPAFSDGQCRWMTWLWFP
jgi:hypothetical protein